METCRMADTCPYQQIRFLKNYLLTILLWTINQRKEIMYVLVSFYFPQNINFINGEWNNVFIDKTFEGHEKQLLSSLKKQATIFANLKYVYIHVLIVNLNCLWNKSGYRYTPVYMYIIYIILVCPCLEEKEICWRFLLQGGRSRPHLTREIKKKLNSFYIIIKYAYQ